MTGSLSSLRLCLGPTHYPTIAPRTGPASLILGIRRPDGAEDRTLILITEHLVLNHSPNRCQGQDPNPCFLAHDDDGR